MSTTTADQLFDELHATYKTLVELDPKRALEALHGLENVLRLEQDSFPQLSVRHDEDEERDYLTLAGQDVEVISLDVSYRWTYAEDDTDEETVRFDYSETADYEGLMYAVEAGNSLLQPVRLPDGWEESSL